MDGYFDERGMPVLALTVSPHGSRITALIDTGFDGELLVYHDQLRAIGVDVVFDRAEQLRLADGSEVTLLGSTLTIDWHGEPRRVNLDVVPTRAPPRGHEPFLVVGYYAILSSSSIFRPAPSEFRAEPTRRPSPSVT